MRILLISLALATSLLSSALAQPTKKAASLLPEQTITRAETEAHMRFLASDELQGRRTGDMGNWVAARYIAEPIRLFSTDSARTRQSRNIGVYRVGKRYASIWQRPAHYGWWPSRFVG